MSGPYRAVIADSFHAALASRVLWIALVAIWILLGALAPIGYRETFTTTFRWRDFENGTRMKAMLAQGLVDPSLEGTPVARLAAAMPDSLRRQLRRVGHGEEVRIHLQVLTDALNAALDEEGWYDAEAWQRVVRRQELRQLNAIDRDQLSEPLRRRRARLRIEAALPGVFEARSPRSVTLTYAGIEFPAEFAVDQSRFVSLINQWVVPTLINWLLGFVLVFLGILVTASIVPDMLQPGSLHLLLSKPVSRPLLLLSKFVGGCAFVFLCVSQLVVGLWLIAGWRLDVWNARLLWCIPVFVFLFAVYYSVSVVAGLKWRSPILAIGTTCMFGAFCLVIGMVGGLFDQLVTQPDRLTAIVWAAAPEAAPSQGATPNKASSREATSAGQPVLIAATRGGGLVRLSAESDRWIELFEGDAMSRDLVLPPIRFGSDSVVTARIRGGRFNPYGSGSLDLLWLSPRNDWQPQPTVRLPVATTELATAGGEMLLAKNTGGLMITSRESVLEAAGVAVADEQSADSAEEPAERGGGDGSAAPASAQEGWLANLLTMQGRATSHFQSILPEEVAVVPPADLAVSDDGQWLVLAMHGRIVRLQRPRGDPRSPWRLTAERRLPGEPSVPAVVAAEGMHVLVAREDAPLLVLDAETLATVGSVEPEDSGPVTDAVGLGDGSQFALLTGEGRVRVVRVAGAALGREGGKRAALGTEPPAGGDSVARAPGGQRGAEWADVELPIREAESLSVHEPSGTLVVAHHVDRVALVDIQTWQVRRWLRPALDPWRWVEHYLVTPLRTLTPQTGELGEAVAAIVSGESTVSLDADDPEQLTVVRYEIVRPVLTCTAFIALMLTIGCVYFTRRDY